MRTHLVRVAEAYLTNITSVLVAKLLAEISVRVSDADFKPDLPIFSKQTCIFPL